MKSEPGTYALILENRSEGQVQVGRWRPIDLERGNYVYIGSAFGPGGVRSRVLRHCRKDKPKHWHIDYLGEHLTPFAVWFSHDRTRLEHRWARALLVMDDMIPIEGFGCSDCNCYSHLFHTTVSPNLTEFSKLASGNVEFSRCSWEGQT